MRKPSGDCIKGLYGMADAGGSNGDPVGLAHTLLDGGCRLIQLRFKTGSPSDVARAAEAIRQITRQAGAAFVVNDDPQLAAHVGADGLHLGQLDGAMDAARAQFGGWIGRSTHTLDQIAHALGEGADYLAFGPIFATDNLSLAKPVRGVDHLERAREAIPRHIPLVAIGGITEANLPEIRDAGADAWAVIGEITNAPDRAAKVRALLG